MKAVSAHRERNKLSPSEVVALAWSLAELSLLHARYLAYLLPSSTSVETHSQIGLGIGAAGRAVKRFLEVAGDFVLAELAPSAPEEWYAHGFSASARSVEAPCAFADVIHGVLEYVEVTGLAAHDFHLALLECQVSRGYAGSVPCPLPSLNAKTVLRDLLALEDTRSARKQSIVLQSRRGNREKNYDPRWHLLTLDASLPRMQRIETEEGLLHKLHHTAFRESVAAEVAGLNLLEYDGLPWKFYIDMARQCEDEARHALLAARRLEELGGYIGQFPIGHLGNYYDMFWEMTLSERLVAMNLDTEAVGQNYLLDIAQRLHAIGDSETATLFEFLLTDERRHARFGARWLRYMWPDTNERKEVIVGARALMIVNVASAYAQASGCQVGEAIDQWLARGGPVRFEAPDEATYEKEVSLLTARRGEHRTVGHPGAAQQT